MEDIFGPYQFIIVYIDDVLVFSRDVSEHKKHLYKFYELVFSHGLVLSDSKEKFQTSKIELHYLGLHIYKGSVTLQPHILSHLAKFPDFLPNKVSVQRFLGCLNYVRQFYEKQVNDTEVLQ